MRSPYWCFFFFPLLLNCGFFGSTGSPDVVPIDSSATEANTEDVSPSDANILDGSIPPAPMVGPNPNAMTGTGMANAGLRSIALGPASVDIDDNAIDGTVSMSAQVIPMPAPLPTGVTLAGRVIDVTVSEPSRVVGPLHISINYDPAQTPDPGRLAVLHFDSTQMRWVPASLTGVDTQRRVVSFSARRFSPFAAVTIPSSFPTAWTPNGFDYQRDTPSVINETSLLSVGNCAGYALATAWYFKQFRANGTSMQGLRERFVGRDEVMRLLALRMQLRSMPGNTRSHFFYSTLLNATNNHPRPVSLLKYLLQTENAPIALHVADVTAPNAVHSGHMVAVYGWDANGFLVYDSNYPNAPKRVTYTGETLDAYAPDPAAPYYTRFALMTSDLWPPNTALQELLTRADGNFSRDSVLSISTPMDGASYADPVLQIEGSLISEQLNEDWTPMVFAYGEYYPADRIGDTIRSTIPLLPGPFQGWIVGAPMAQQISRQPQLINNSDFITRRVRAVGTGPAPKVIAILTWNAYATDLNLYLVPQNHPEQTVWFDNQTGPAGTQATDRGGLGPEFSYILDSGPDAHTLHNEDYLVRVQFLSDGRGGLPPSEQIVNARLRLLVRNPTNNTYTRRECTFQNRETNSMNAQPIVFDAMNQRQHNRGPDWRTVIRFNPATGAVQAVPDSWNSAAYDPAFPFLHQVQCN